MTRIAILNDVAKEATAIREVLTRRLPGLTEDDIAFWHVHDETTFRRCSEQIATTDGGVILGRAAAIVLRDRPAALHVRLDGPAEARVKRAMSFEQLDEEQARKLLGETDRAREAYVKHFYKCDPRDASHYHLVLDSTALELDTCVDLIVTAARARNITPS